MRICAIVKYPPIQGGVSAYSYWLCHALASAGHDVHVVTNADEVEPEYRIWMRPGDSDMLAVDYPGGGRVTARSTTPWDADRYHHIPAGNPTVTKLAALATEVVREHDCEVIFTFYLEPYAVAASLASNWTGTSYVARHAGSDRFALMAHPELALAYKEVLRTAGGLINAGVDFGGFDVPAGKVFEAPPALVAPEFSPEASPFDLNALAAELLAEGAEQVVWPGPLRSDLPVFGLYGKVGELKGTIDAVKALSVLDRRGAPVQLAILGGGIHWPTVRDAVESHGLKHRVWRFPFLAPWHVPRFIRACDAVGVLERDFEIKQHGPRIAAEVLACGTPLVCSAEIAAKQDFLRDQDMEQTLTLVPDPSDIEQLAGALAQVGGPRPAHIGAAAVGVVPAIDQHAFARGYADILASVVAGVAEDDGPEAVTDVLRRRCPAAVRILGDKLPDLPEHGAGRSGRLRAFGALSSMRGTGGSRSDLLRLEEHLLWMSVDVEGLAGVPAFRAPVRLGQRIDGSRADTARPVASYQLRFDEFAFDVHQYVAAIDAGVAHEPPEVTRGRNRLYLFHKRPHLGGSVYRINHSVERVLRLCDGSRSVGQIAEEVGRGADVVAVLLQRLHEVDIVGLVDGGLSDVTVAG